MTLAEFLLARCAEDRARILSLGEGGLRLAECKSKRLLVLELRRMQDEEMGWDGVEHKVMTYLALPYADHPDYLSEWRP